MELEGIIISSGVTIFSIGLLLVSVVSYKKYRSTKLLFISCVFVVLLIKGILYTSSVFVPTLEILNTILFSIYGGLFDLVLLVLLFVATLKR